MRSCYAYALPLLWLVGLKFCVAADGGSNLWPSLLDNVDEEEQELRHAAQHVPQDAANPYAYQHVDTVHPSGSFPSHDAHAIQRHGADGTSDFWLNMYNSASNPEALEHLASSPASAAVQTNLLQDTGAHLAYSVHPRDPHNAEGTHLGGTRPSVDTIAFFRNRAAQFDAPVEPGDSNRARLLQLPSNTAAFDISSIRPPPELDHEARISILNRVKTRFERTKEPRWNAVVHAYRGQLLSQGLIAEAFGLRENLGRFGGYLRKIEPGIYATQSPSKTKTLQHTFNEGGMHPQADKKFQAYIWQRFPAEQHVGSIFRLIGMVEGSKTVDSVFRESLPYHTRRMRVEPLGRDSLVDTSAFVPVGHNDWDL